MQFQISKAHAIFLTVLSILQILVAIFIIVVGFVFSMLYFMGAFVPIVPSTNPIPYLGG
jgi:hypothetical protein